MQYLIIKQYKQYLFDLKRPNANDLRYAFESSMPDAINKIYTKMNRKTAGFFLVQREN